MLKKLLSSFAVAAIVAASYTLAGAAAEMGYAPQISNEREIKVTAMLQTFTKEAKTWDFEVTLETHTQSLSDDLIKSSVLIADGKQYLPLVWEGAPPGGHHRKGFLRFNAVSPQPQSMELRIRLAGDALPRSFKWSMK
jgi:hypothetical protein